MATTFFIRTTQKSGNTYLFARYQSVLFKLDHRTKTSIDVDIARWKATKGSITAQKNFFKFYPNVKAEISKIEREIDALTSNGAKAITAEEFKEAINTALTREIKQKQEEERIAEAERKVKEAAERKAKKEAENKPTLGKVVVKIAEMYKNGTLKNERSKDKTFRTQTIKNTLSTAKMITEFVKDTKDWDLMDIDKNFYLELYNYISSKENYKPNTLESHIKTLQSILAKAQDLNIMVNHKFRNYKVKFSEVFNIALTKKELELLEVVDLSDMADTYNKVRDLFLAGCYSSQRVSDYQKIKSSAITEREGFRYMVIQQQKTGKEAIIPITKELESILERNNGELPKVQPQTINDYIKIIAEKAGINSIVEVGEESVPKYKLISSHTARRTACTLMAQNSIPAMEICKISGHSSEFMLKKYIKSTIDEKALALKKFEKFF